MSDDCPDSCDYTECEGLVGSMSSHLAKLGSLSARGCADKFFKVHTARWGKSMARPGDYLHSAILGLQPNSIYVKVWETLEIYEVGSHSFAVCFASRKH
jgi:hypothetical protein